MAVSGYDIAAFAKQWVGTPYVWGGNSLSGGIDCSGLVQQVYKNFGINTTRTTYTQIGEGKAIKQSDLQAGDLVFFDTDPRTGGPDHVAIYLGNGKMIHAPRPGKNVEIVSMDSGYYQGIFMGGRRISGVEGGGPASESEPTVAARLSPEELAAEYGWAYSFLNSIPEVKNLFKLYVAEDWDKSKFQARLRDTNWWKENSATMRKTAQEKQTDPATYNAKLTATKIQIMKLAAEIGASIPSGKLDKITEEALQSGMDEAHLRYVLGEYVTWTENNNLRGAAGMFEHNMQKFAADQGIKLDKQTLMNQAALIAKGVSTEEDFRTQITEQAASMYPAYTDQLQAGQTMKQIASAYTQIMIQDLHLNPATVTLDDPLIKGALNGTNQQGKPVGMDLTSFQKMVRNDPRWSQTQAAQDAVMKTGLRVLKDMGLAGGK